MKSRTKKVLNRTEIESQIDNGSTMAFLAEKYEMNYQTFVSRCKAQNIRTKRIKQGA